MVLLLLLAVVVVNGTVFEQARSFETENKLILNFVPVFSMWWLESVWNCDDDEEEDEEEDAVLVRLLNASRSTSRVFLGRTNMDLNELDMLERRVRMALFWFCCCWCWLVDELFDDDDEEDNENEREEDDEDDIE